MTSCEGCILGPSQSGRKGLDSDARTGREAAGTVTVQENSLQINNAPIVSEAEGTHESAPDMTTATNPATTVTTPLISGDGAEELACDTAGVGARGAHAAVLPGFRANRQPPIIGEPAPTAPAPIDAGDRPAIMPAGA